MCNSCNSWRSLTSFVWPKYRVSLHQLTFSVSQFWNELNFSKLVYLCWKRLLFGTVLKINGPKTEFRSKTKLKKNHDKRELSGIQLGFLPKWVAIRLFILMREIIQNWLWPWEVDQGHGTRASQMLLEISFVPNALWNLLLFRRPSKE